MHVSANWGGSDRSSVGLSGVASSLSAYLKIQTRQRARSIIFHNICFFQITLNSACCTTMMVQSCPYAQAPKYSQPNRQKEFFLQRPVSKGIF